MKLSFLYKIPEEESKTPANTVYNLSLDRTMDLACSDVKAARYFLTVAAKPLTIRENIFYRREILDDFLRDGELYYELFDLLGKLYDEQRLNEKERKYRYSLIRQNDDAVSFQNTKQALQMTAMSMRNALDIISELYELLCKKDLKSEGFQNLVSSLRFIKENPSYRELLDITAYFRDISDIESVESRIYIDSDCNILQSRLVACNRQRQDETKQSGGSFRFFKKQKEKEPEKYRKLKDISLPLGSSVMFAAFSEPAKMMDKIITAIYKKFEDLREEMLFYKAGLKLISFYKEKNIPFVFPEISEKPEFCCHNLLDTYLCAYYPTITAVVPNEAVISDEKRGILVFGQNNSGKTVYLRSIGTAQLFAQAGFPITAESGTIGIRSGIFTQFASGEKEFEEGNEAGRFEQEVREIAALVDTSDENALILFNETFQTTAYSEGATGLYYVLQYLSSRRTNWVLVSHLTDLDGKFGSDVINLHTAEGYKMLAV